MIDPIWHDFAKDDVGKHLSTGLDACEICGLRLSHRRWCPYTGNRQDVGVFQQPLLSRFKSWMMRRMG